MTYVFKADEDVLFFNDRFLNSETQIMFNELNIPFFHHYECQLNLTQHDINYTIENV